MAKIALLLKTRSLEDKLVLTSNILTNLTGNPVFTTPNPPLVDVGALKVDIAQFRLDIADLETAIAVKRIELLMKEVELDSALTALASYAENVTTDAAELESGGFPLARDPQPIGVLPAPTNIVAVPGQLGTCALRWPRGSRGVKTFKAQCASSVDGPWTTIYEGTRARCTATELVSGQLYWFRVAALGTAGQSDWSDPVPKRAA